MRLTNLTYAIININAAIDTGKYKYSVKEIEQHIATGDVFQFISEQCKDDVDLSLIRGDIENEIVIGLQEILGGNRERVKRKWGIENNGLCLLLAFVNELIQLRKWMD